MLFKALATQQYTKKNKKFQTLEPVGISSAQ